MSALSFPRFYFRGKISWDPSTSNNTREVYDAANAKVNLPAGVDWTQFKKWMMGMNGPAIRCGWNYFGLHTVAFTADTTITAADLGPAQPFPQPDTLLTKAVQFVGRACLVDVDPASFWNSQIFFKGFAFGDASVGMRGASSLRMHSRHINFARNFSLPIAGVASVQWQTCIAKSVLQLNNSQNSAIVNAFQKELQLPESLGIAVRFCTYRTEYYKNGVYNSEPHQPRSDQDLSDLYLNGGAFSNPAYSLVAGVVSIWKQDELLTAPLGRLLKPTANVSVPGASLRPVPLGTAIAELNSAKKCLSLDLSNTMPELDVHAEKADFGILNVSITAPDATTSPLATIPYQKYNKTSYEASAGIIDLPLSDANIVAIEQGRLSISVSQGGKLVTALREDTYFAATDERGVYLDQSHSATVKFRAFSNGKVAPSKTKLLLVEYDDQLNISQAPCINLSQNIVSPDANGLYPAVFSSVRPGFPNLRAIPFDGDTAAPTPPMKLNPAVDFYASIRVMPFDDSLAASIKDEQLTWQFVYENILRPFDMLMPGMNTRFDLSNPDAVRNEAPNIAARVDSAQFETPGYMPITRDLSNGKRALLVRWCNLVSGGNEPQDLASTTLSSINKLF